MNLTVTQVISKLPTLSNAQIHALYVDMGLTGGATTPAEETEEIKDALRALPDQNDSGLTDADLGLAPTVLPTRPPTTAKKFPWAAVLIGLVICIVLGAVALSLMPKGGPTDTGATIKLTSKAELATTEGTALKGVKLAFSGGKSPYTVKLDSCKPACAWLKVDEKTGALSGTPDKAGSYVATLKVIDANKEPGTVKVTLKVVAKAADDGAPEATEEPAATEVAATEAPVVEEAVATLSNVAGFTPDWSGLDANAPSVEEVLKAHGLTADMVTVVDSRKTSWEPALVVIELKPEYQGKTVLPLLNGYQYTAATTTDVTTFWGGDPNVTEVTLQWGTSIRWMPAYKASDYGIWAIDACELVTREYRFGRYMRNADSGQPDVPYFGRVGPYVTMPGNIDCKGWVVPAIDEFVPQSYLQAAAILGGRAVESEWTHSDDFMTWSWKHTEKGTGNESTAKFYWQTVYMPQSSNGYVELWLGKGKTGPGGVAVSADGAYKFTYTDLAILLDGLHNVDEFSYHAAP